MTVFVFHGHDHFALPNFLYYCFLNVNSRTIIVTFLSNPLDSGWVLEQYNTGFLLLRGHFNLIVCKCERYAN